MMRRENLAEKHGRSAAYNEGMGEWRDRDQGE